MRSKGGVTVQYIRSHQLYTIQSNPNTRSDSASSVSATSPYLTINTTTQKTVGHQTVISKAAFVINSHVSVVHSCSKCQLQTCLYHMYVFANSTKITVIVLLYTQQCDQEWNYVAIKIECLYNVALISFYVLRMVIVHLFYYIILKVKSFIWHLLSKKLSMKAYVCTSHV